MLHIMTTSSLRRLFGNLALLLFTLVLAAPTLAHPPGADGHHDHEHGDHDHDKKIAKTIALKKAAAPKGMVLPQIDGPKPWSDKPVLDDPNRFQIAIMTDRTGGHRKGVWMKAVRAVNQLRPDFVMSVGDLIEGYTDSEEKAEEEWKEFLGFIDQMDMRFFFVAGNHDVTNPMLHRVWREKFGPVYYSFDYKDVHFVCLCSEDPNFRIGDEQLAWLKKDLEKSKDARWTLVFLHKPLWVIRERWLGFGMKDISNWKPVEDLLHDRKHTVFAGHTHFYAQFNRNGTKFYQLATTGGISELRGKEYGEFDHIMWLTMEDDGPRVVNLLLDGIVGGDEVNEDTLKQFRAFLAKAKVEVAPILLDDKQSLSEGRIDVRLINEYDRPVRVSGRIEGLPLKGLTVDPVDLTLEAGAGETKTLSVQVRFNEPIPFADLEQTVFRAFIETADSEAGEVVKAEGASPEETDAAVAARKPYRAEQAVPVVIDRRFHCPPTKTPIKLDGKLDEWPELSHRTPNPPVLLGPAEQYQGPQDCSFVFDVARDDEFIYFAARVTDDRVVEGKDELVLLLDGRPISIRSQTSTLGPGSHSVGFKAGNHDSELEIFAYKERTSQCNAAVRKVEGGYVVEAALPVSLLTSQQGKSWHSFQCTPMALDVDDEQEEPVGVVWRGTRALRKSNKNFGHFVRVTP